MAEIGFYHLTSTPLERALPKILEKAVGQGHRIQILAESEELLERLDSLLWTYDPNSFLPHGTVRDDNAEVQPILLSSSTQDNVNGANILAMIDGQEPASLEAYERVIDMFDGRHEPTVKAARLRWQKWKEGGHSLTYWRQNENGIWAKAA